MSKKDDLAALLWKASEAYFMEGTLLFCRIYNVSCRVFPHLENPKRVDG